MKLSGFKTKNLLIGNLLYFENGVGSVSTNRYLAIKTKERERYTILSDNENLPEGLSALLGVDSRVDNISSDKYYLINTRYLNEILSLKRLSFDEVVRIAKDLDDFENGKEKSIK